MSSFRATNPVPAIPRWAFWEHASATARGWALALLTIAVFLPSLAGDFIWDDWSVLVREPLVRRWDGIVAIWLAPSERMELHYWPLVYTSFWLEHKLWGLHAVGYHAVNLGLHVLNSLLLWRLLLRLRVPGAWLAAAVFAVHPIHVESVAWIIERKDLLSGLFYLAAILVWVHPGSVQSAPTPRRTTPRRTLACLALFLMALLSKSIAVTLPAALLLLRWWQAGRLEWRDVWHVVPFWALGAAVVAADLWFYQSTGTFAFEYSAVERLLLAGRAVWVYAAQLAWPVHLPVIYARWDVHVGNVAGWCALAALGGLAAALWAARGRLGRGPLAGFGYFVLALSPVLGFVDFGFMRIAFVADRFAYLASIGPIAVVAGAAVCWARRGAAGRVGIALAAALALAALGALTWRQVDVYRDDATHARHAADMNPQHWFTQTRLAGALLGEGRHEDAIAVARRGARLAAESRGVPPHDANYAVGTVLLAQDRPAEAAWWYRKDIASEPRRFGLAVARWGLAEALVRHASYAEGLALYRQHLENEPKDDAAHASRAAALLAAGDHAAAAASYRRALAVVRHPTSEAHWERDLGEVLRVSGRLEEAAVHIDRSLSLNPRNIWTLIARARLEAARSPGGADARRTGRERGPSPGRPWLERAREVVEDAREQDPENMLVPIALGAVLLRMEAYGDARDVLLEALDWVRDRSLRRQTHKLLGEVLVAQGETVAAADHYRRALLLFALDHEALEGLATIHREAGRFEDALPLWRRYADVRPRLAAAHWRLGETLHRLGRSGALTSLERALDINPALDEARKLRNAVRQTPSGNASGDGQLDGP